jgi:hypothetical protein
MTFSIGSQSGGIINNVQGDQRISGGQHGVLVTEAAAREAVASLRAALAAAPLDEATAASAHAQAAEIGVMMRDARPDRRRVAPVLERLTRLLGAAGSLASAGAALTGPLQTLAAWLGAAGEPVLRLISALS